MKKNIRNQQALKGGSYALIITAVVLAILLVVNLFAVNLPSTLTKLDISSGKLYSITSNTKVVVNNLQQDVTIYWVVQADQEDSILDNLLSKYDSLSSHIDVVKKNPDIFPTFTEQYTDEDVPNNSLIVVSGDRYRYVSYTDIYEIEADYYSYSYTVSGFDGEGAITSAIDYVVTEQLPKLYTLEGHGETALPDTFSEAIDKENIELDSLSLLTVDEIPEDAAGILIYAPASDLSEQEAQMLADYTASGGKLWVCAGPVEGVTLHNLNSLLSDYGVEIVDGIVVEGSRDYYAFGSPLILMPQMQSHEITDSLIEKNYYTLLPVAQGLDVSSADSCVTTLLTTSDAAFSKAAGYEMETYEMEDGDIAGPFALAVSVQTDGDGQIIWFSASEYLSDRYNAYSSGANVDLTMNALSSLLGEREAMAIRSKSLNYNYLTISESTSSVLKTLMIGVFPLAYLGIGIVVILKKRSEQHETV